MTLTVVGIYMLLVYETGSYLMPMILMISIPLTVIGIIPGFWLLNVLGGVPVDGWGNPTFFTATGMIGMIALSGIAVRNAILLIEFVHRLTGRGIGAAVLDDVQDGREGLVLYDLVVVLCLGDAGRHVQAARLVLQDLSPVEDLAARFHHRVACVQ